MFIELQLKTTDEQRMIIADWLKTYRELCEWLNASAPPELQRFKQLYYWSYYRLLQRGAGPMAAEMITGRVSNCRSKGKALDAGGILFQDRMMLIDLAEKSVLLPLVKVVTKPPKYSRRRSKRVTFDFLALKFESKEQIPQGKVTGGLLVDKADAGYIFVLRVEPLDTRADHCYGATGDHKHGNSKP